MHANLNVSVLEFNRRSVRPHFEFVQLVDRNVLQCTDPLSWDQEASIAARDDLNGIPFGRVAWSRLMTIVDAVYSSRLSGEIIGLQRQQ